MSSVDHYVAIYRNESAQVITDAIEAVSSVEAVDAAHRRKLADICAGLMQLLLEADRDAPQGSLF